MSWALAFALFSTPTQAIEITPDKPKPGGAQCFTREESEDIYACLKMREMYYDSMRASLIDQPGFFDTPMGKVALLGAGFLFGYTLGKR